MLGRPQPQAFVQPNGYAQNMQEVNQGELSVMQAKKVHLYELITRQLVDDGYIQTANELARITNVSIPGNIPSRKLESLVDKGRLPTSFVSELEGEMKILEDEEDKIELPKSKQLPSYKTKFVTTHKDMCKVACFSQDGQLVATGSSDCSIKLLQVSKMHYHSHIKGEKVEDYTATKPVIRTFYDHNQEINDLGFHPIEPFLVSCSSDCTIKFFDHSKPSAKRSYRYIQESYPVRSVHFHPSGDFLLASTDQKFIRLYDINTFQAYISPDSTKHHASAVSQVRWSDQGGVYASCGVDGDIKIWDTVNNKCINTISKAHGGAEVSTVQFSPSQKYLLSGGKDSTGKLWDLSSGQKVMDYEGAHHEHKRLHTCFSFTGDFILSSDEKDLSVAAWDTRTGELVKKLTGHNKAVRCVCASPLEEAFISCSEDFRARFWVAS